MSALSRANDRVWSWTSAPDRLWVATLRLLFVVLVSETIFLAVITLPLVVVQLPFGDLLQVYAVGYVSAVAGMVGALFAQWVAR